MTTMTVDWSRLSDSWDAQQASYLPDREERYAAMLDVVAAVAPERPRVLDLAGGLGSISQRALARFPDADVTLLDIDPALLAIGAGTLGGTTVRIVSADLLHAGWRDGLGGDFDVVLTATALHWIPEQRLAGLYGEIRDVLRPGGVFVNADHAPDDGLPALSGRLQEVRAGQSAEVWSRGDALDWSAWWRSVAAEPALVALVAERDARFGGESGHAAEFNPPASWHVDTLRAAGYAEVGLVWRGLTDAAVAAVRGTE